MVKTSATANATAVITIIASAALTPGLTELSPILIPVGIINSKNEIKTFMQRIIKAKLILLYNLGNMQQTSAILHIILVQFFLEIFNTMM